MSWAVSDLVGGGSGGQSRELKVEKSCRGWDDKLLMRVIKIGLLGSVETGIVFLEGRFILVEILLRPSLTP